MRNFALTPKQELVISLNARIEVIEKTGVSEYSKEDLLALLKRTVAFLQAETSAEPVAENAPIKTTQIDVEQKGKLAEIMRNVDLGVTTCIDAILEGGITLENAQASATEKESAKQTIKLNAIAYRWLLGELIKELEPNQPQPTQQPSPTPNPKHRDYLHIGLYDSLADKLDTFSALLSVLSYFPEVVSSNEDYGANLKLADIAEVYKVYGDFVNNQYRELHKSALATVQGGK
ncbi:hypothetical protein A1D22_00745 [Pasteurellaceae bacterium LFhippo2]|nr:hypothetical protein [Pasteurellaceae bacterium LFhippo2]